MDRLILPIALKHQHTRPPMIGWIVFHNNGFDEPGQNVFHKKTVFRQFIGAKVGQL